ncbi:hypothetical protein DICA1_C18426 [Diutina catenulata]
MAREYQSKKSKLVGLQKLEFYCQICSKQCRDKNGFQMHVASPPHRAKIAAISESGDAQSVVAKFSAELQRDFLRLLKITHGTKAVDANRFYQEYIADKNHVHMNATRWSSLSQFVRYLGDRGLVTVTGESALNIALVDADEKDRQQRAQELEREEADEGQLEEKLMKQRIAQKAVPSQDNTKVVAEQPVKVSLKRKQKKTNKSVFDD